MPSVDRGSMIPFVSSRGIFDLDRVIMNLALHGSVPKIFCTHILHLYYTLLPLGQSHHIISYQLFKAEHPKLKVLPEAARHDYSG